MSERKKVIAELKKLIKENAAKSRVIAQGIRSSSGDDRWNLWEEKRSLGSRTRHILLAYAYLRNRPYHVAEKCSLNNQPSLGAVLNQLRNQATKESVSSWLDSDTIKDLEVRRTYSQSICARNGLMWNEPNLLQDDKSGKKYLEWSFGKGIFIKYYYGLYKLVSSGKEIMYPGGDTFSIFSTVSFAFNIANHIEAA